MLEMKKSQRSRVVNRFDGRVVKFYHGPKARERFVNEVRVLRWLNDSECPFVPTLLEIDRQSLSIIIEYMGQSVEHLSESRCQEVFDQLLDYGVRHDDPAPRNVLYDPRTAQFAVIDFEFASIVGRPMRHDLEVECKMDAIEALLASA
jgi:tRNA A-37 threonylcarbamoyl transferase component Bud32